MKAIIVDMDDGYLIVLNKKGDFKKIYNNMPWCQIGDEIEVPDRMPLFGLSPGWPLSLAPARKIAVALVVFLLLLGMGGYGIADYLTPVTFVTMDINPSVELALNRYERVLSVNAFNDEGNLLAKDGSSFRNMKLENAIKELLDRAEAQNYLKASSTLIFTVSSMKNHVPEELDRKLKKTVEARPGIQVIVENTTIEKHEEARRMNISQGKLLIYEKLKKINPEITLEEVKKSPVSRIMEQLNKSLSDKGKPSTEKKEDKKTDLKTPDINKEKPAYDKGSPAEKMEKKPEKAGVPGNLNKNDDMQKAPEKAKSNGNKPSVEIIKFQEKTNKDMSDTTGKLKDDTAGTMKNEKKEALKEQKSENTEKGEDQGFFNKPEEINREINNTKKSPGKKER